MSLDDVLAPLHDYARGHATGDPACFRRAFLPTGHVEGLRDGEFTVVGPRHLLRAVRRNRRRTTKPPGAAPSTRSTSSGTVATATMTLRHGDATFTDMFVLLHVDGGWRIANKVYHRHTD